MSSSPDLGHLSSGDDEFALNNQISVLNAAEAAINTPHTPTSIDINFIMNNINNNITDEKSPHEINLSMGLPNIFHQTPSKPVFSTASPTKLLDPQISQQQKPKDTTRNSPDPSIANINLVSPIPTSHKSPSLQSPLNRHPLPQSNLSQPYTIPSPAPTKSIPHDNAFQFQLRSHHFDSSEGTNNMNLATNPSFHHTDDLTSSMDDTMISTPGLNSSQYDNQPMIKLNLKNTKKSTLHDHKDNTINLTYNININNSCSPTLYDTIPAIHNLLSRPQSYTQNVQFCEMANQIATILSADFSSSAYTQERPSSSLPISSTTLKIDTTLNKSKKDPYNSILTHNLDIYFGMFEQMYSFYTYFLYFSGLHSNIFNQYMPPEKKTSETHFSLEMDDDDDDINISSKLQPQSGTLRSGMNFDQFYKTHRIPIQTVDISSNSEQSDQNISSTIALTSDVCVCPSAIQPTDDPDVLYTSPQDDLSSLTPSVISLNDSIMLFSGHDDSTNSPSLAQTVVDPPKSQDLQLPTPSLPFLSMYYSHLVNPVYLFNTTINSISSSKTSLLEFFYRNFSALHPINILTATANTLLAYNPLAILQHQENAQHENESNDNEHFGSPLLDIHTDPSILAQVNQELDTMARINQQYQYDVCFQHILAANNKTATNSPQSPSERWPERFPHLTFHRTMCLVLYNLLRHLLTIVITFLLKQLNITREYNKFWKHHINLPWYYNLRSKNLYRLSREHTLDLFTIEVSLTQCIGESYNLLMILNHHISSHTTGSPTRPRYNSSWTTCEDSMYDVILNSNNQNTIGGVPFEDGYMLYDRSLLDIVSNCNKTNVQRENEPVENDQNLLNRDFQHAFSSIHVHNTHLNYINTALDTRNDKHDNSRLKISLHVNNDPFSAKELLHFSSSVASPSSQLCPLHSTPINPFMHTISESSKPENPMITPQLSGISSLPSQPESTQQTIFKYLSSYDPQLRWRNPVELGHSPLFVSIIFHLVFILQPLYEENMIALCINYFYTPGTAHPIIMLSLLKDLSDIIFQITREEEPLRLEEDGLHSGQFQEKTPPPSSPKRFLVIPHLFYHKPIPHFKRKWPVYAAGSVFLSVIAYFMFKNKEIVQEHYIEAKRAAHAFLDEHFFDPIQSIYQRLFFVFFTKTKRHTEAQNVAASRAELEKMLFDFGSRHSEEISRLENKSKADFLLELPERSKKIDMTLVTSKFSSNVKEPLKHLYDGGIFEALVLQTDKLMHSVMESLWEMDLIIEQNEINFNIMATTPIIMAVAMTFSLLRWMIGTYIKPDHTPDALLDEVRHLMHKIELILIKQSQQHVSSKQQRHGHFQDNFTGTPTFAQFASNSKTHANMGKNGNDQLYEDMNFYYTQFYTECYQFYQTSLNFLRQQQVAAHSHSCRPFLHSLSLSPRLGASPAVVTPFHAGTPTTPILGLADPNISTHPYATSSRNPRYLDSTTRHPDRHNIRAFNTLVQSPQLARNLSIYETHHLFTAPHHECAAPQLPSYHNGAGPQPLGDTTSHPSSPLPKNELQTGHHPQDSSPSDHENDISIFENLRHHLPPRLVLYHHAGMNLSPTSDLGLQSDPTQQQSAQTKQNNIYPPPQQGSSQSPRPTTTSRTNMNPTLAPTTLVHTFSRLPNNNTSGNATASFLSPSSTTASPELNNPTLNNISKPMPFNSPGGGNRSIPNNPIGGAQQSQLRGNFVTSSLSSTPYHNNLSSATHFTPTLEQLPQQQLPSEKFLSQFHFRPQEMLNNHYIDSFITNNQFVEGQNGTSTPIIPQSISLFFQGVFGNVYHLHPLHRTCLACRLFIDPNYTNFSQYKPCQIASTSCDEDDKVDAQLIRIDNEYIHPLRQYQNVNIQLSAILEDINALEDALDFDDQICPPTPLNNKDDPQNIAGFPTDTHFSINDAKKSTSPNNEFDDSDDEQYGNFHFPQQTSTPSPIANINNSNKSRDKYQPGLSIAQLSITTPQSTLQQELSNFHLHTNLCHVSGQNRKKYYTITINIISHSTSSIPANAYNIVNPMKSTTTMILQNNTQCVLGAYFFPIMVRSTSPAQSSHVNQQLQYQQFTSTCLGYKQFFTSTSPSPDTKLHQNGDGDITLPVHLTKNQYMLLPLTPHITQRIQQSLSLSSPAQPLDHRTDLNFHTIISNLSTEKMYFSSPKSLSYLLLYVNTLVTIIERLNVHNTVKTDITLINIIKQLALPTLSVQQKLLIIQHIYAAFDLFKYKSNF